MSKPSVITIVLILLSFAAAAVVLLALIKVGPPSESPEDRVVATATP